MSYVDDFLLLTLEPETAKLFLRTMTQGTCTLYVCVHVQCMCINTKGYLCSFST